MAAGTALQVSSGSGPYLSLGPTYTESGKTVADQKVIAGLPYLPSYVVSLQPSIAAAGVHLFELMAGATLNVSVLRIEVNVFVASAGANLCQFGLYRLTTAGTGGTVIGTNALDTTDLAAAATCMSAPTAKGSEAANIWAGAFSVPGASQVQNGTLFTIDYRSRLSKPLRIPAGTANGLALKNITSVTSSSVAIMIYFVETPF